MRGRYFGVDVTVAEYQAGLPRTPNVLGDATAMPMLGECCDLVLFSNVFYYFGAPAAVLTETRRVLIQAAEP